MYTRIRTPVNMLRIIAKKQKDVTQCHLEQLKGSKRGREGGREGERRRDKIKSTIFIFRMVDDLHRLLHVSSSVDNAPVLLVGTDFSSLISRFYAQFYER